MNERRPSINEMDFAVAADRGLPADDDKQLPLRGVRMIRANRSTGWNSALLQIEGMSFAGFVDAPSCSKRGGDVFAERAEPSRWRTQFFFWQRREVDLFHHLKH